jgi:hypothetical protein
MRADSKKLTVTLPVIAAVLTIFTLNAMGAGETKQLSKEQVKELIGSARTAADHERLAAYYQDEAARLQAEQRDHNEQAAEYLKNPSSHPVPKYPTMGQHCRELADYYGQAAKKATELASMHEELARTPAH